MAIEKTYLTGSGVQLGTSHFDLQAQKPLDSRTTVPEFAGLQALIDGKAAYEGMIVYDEETKKTYQAHKVTVTEDDETSKVILQFKEFGINQEELKALIASETTAAMEFKGVAASLPENPSNGDMYKVGKVGETEPDITVDGVTAKAGDAIVAKVVVNEDKSTTTTWYLIPAGDDIEDTWRPITGVDSDATLTFAAGNKLDVAVAANGIVTYSHEAIDAPTATPVGKDEQTRTYIASIETDGFGHITGYKTATENVENTNTTYEFEGLPVGEDEEAPSSVYFQVKSSEEEAAEVIYLDTYSKNEADAAFKAKRAEALAAVATDANVFVDTVAQDVDGNITITTKAVDFSAITDRLDDLEAIDHTHNFADEEALSGITAAKVADWDDAVSKEHTHTFADTDVEDAITKKHSHTFTDADVEDAISKEHTHNFSDEAALNGITAAKVADWDDAVSKEHTHTFADSDVEDAIAKKHSHTFVETELNKIADGDVAKWNTAAGKADDNAQAIEDLEDYVGTIPAGATATDIVGYVQEKTAGIATEGAMTELGNRVTVVEGDVATIKGDYLKAADIAGFETKENVKKVADDLAAYVESNDAAVELKADKTALEAEVARANGAYDAKGAAADAQAAAEATASGALATARTEITAEIGTAISGEVSRADGKYEEKGVAQGIVDGLKLAETYEPIGAEGRAIAAAEGKVNTLAGNVYTKEQTYTQAEVDALIQQATQWGEF